MVVTITKPTIGGSEDSWGLIVNTALDDIVDGLNGVTTVAPNLTGGSWQIGGVAVGSTAAELNILDGVTASTAELNILDGVTASTAELNILDGVTASTAEINLLDGVTASTTEINVLDGVTASTVEINYLDGVTSPIQDQINTLVAGESGGTVTSVGLSAPTGFSVSNSPVTSTGTLSLSFASGYSLLTSAQATSISNIPTTTSQLTNDSGFITSSSVPTTTSQLTNNSGFITSSSVPTNTSQLTNDSGFITSSSVPTNNNQLTNGAGYITNADLPTAFGAVGTYAFLVKNGTSIASGASVSGSSLQSGGVNAITSLTGSDTVYAANLTQLARGDTAMSGTWRAMGSVSYSGSSTYGRGTVFLRIS